MNASSATTPRPEVRPVECGKLAQAIPGRPGAGVPAPPGGTSRRPPGPPCTAIGRPQCLPSPKSASIRSAPFGPVSRKLLNSSPRGRTYAAGEQARQTSRHRGPGGASRGPDRIPSALPSRWAVDSNPGPSDAGRQRQREQPQQPPGWGPTVSPSDPLAMPAACLHARVRLVVRLVGTARIPADLRGHHPCPPAHPRYHAGPQELGQAFRPDGSMSGRKA